MSHEHTFTPGEKDKYYQSCLTIRHKLIKHGTMSMGDSPIVYHSESWVIEPCGAPLFGEHVKTGICRSCTQGWQCDTNYPLPADQQPKEWHEATKTLRK